MQAQKDAPTDTQCKDKFLLQSVKANDGATAKDINAEMVIVLQNDMSFACKSLCKTVIYIRIWFV